MQTIEGTIEIEMADFWTWVNQNYANNLDGMETYFGVPKVNKGNDTLEISFAASSEGSPANWAEKPKAVKEWEELK